MTSSFIIRLLPVELIAKIFGDYDFTKHDLMNFRLVCKAICPWASKRLAKDYLSKICVSMTRKDLDVLTKICEHPDMGPHVESIQIDHTRLGRKEIKGLTSAVSEACDAKDVGDIQKAAADLQNCLTRYADEIDMDGSDEAVEKLTLAFAQLKSYGHALSLASAGYREHATVPEHNRVTSTYHDLSYRAAGNTRVRLDYTLQILLRAAHESGVQIDGFYISHCGSNVPQSNNKASPAMEDSQTLQKTCGGLKTLTYETDKAHSKSSSHNLEQFLKASAHLQTVVLNLMMDIHYHCPMVEDAKFGSRVLRWLSSDMLSQVELWNLCVSEKALICFLNKHRATIRYLKVKDCAVYKGSWRSILPWIHVNVTKLHWLRLYKLREVRGECGCTGISVDETFVAKGEVVAEDREAVLSALQSLIKNIT